MIQRGDSRKINHESLHMPNLNRAKYICITDDNSHARNCADSDVLFQDIRVLNNATGAENAKGLPLDKPPPAKLDNECEDSDKPVINHRQILTNTASQYEKLGDRSEEHYYKSLIKDNSLPNRITNADEISEQKCENEMMVQGKCEPSAQRCFDVTQTEESDDGYEPVCIRSDQFYR